jgi:hypothetical protein
VIRAGADVLSGAQSFQLRTMLFSSASSFRGLKDIQRRAELNNLHLLLRREPASGSDGKA